MRERTSISLLGVALLLLAACTPSSGAGQHQGVKAVQVTCGYYDSYALMDDGTVRAWGQGQHGQLGNGIKAGDRFGDPRLDAATPVPVAGLKDVSAIEAGHGAIGAAGSTVFALTGSGKVFVWGADDLSPLGRAADEALPVEAAALAGAKKIALGLGHACALMNDGTVQCWGNGSNGEMGNGTKKKNKIPQPVPGISDAVDIAAGASHVCVVRAGGEVVCWGKNRARQVLPSTTTDQIAPVVVPGVSDVVSLGLDDEISCAVHKDQRLSCWGGYAKEVEVFATGVVQADGADDHICIRKQDGTVHCWGDNDCGQLGQGTAGQPSMSKRPLAVAGVSDAVDIAVGYEHTCAATAAGGVLCWGSNRYGELGDGSLTDRATPVATKSINLPELPPAENGFQAIALSDELQQWQDLAKGCEYSKTLDMAHKALLRDSFEVLGATATIDGKGMITVKIANYPMTSRGRIIAPRGDQLLATIYFIKVKDPAAQKEERVPADAGSYGIATDTVRYTGAMSGVSNSHTSYELRSGVSEDSSIVLTHVGADWVCGTLDITNRYGHMKGSFAAEVRH